MRLWSIHPRYLDPQGLVALWREALLAQAVLRGETRGYRHHPQLQRFQQHAAPIEAMTAYLRAVHAEADARGYAFDAGKLGPQVKAAPIGVTAGQLDFEWRHLMAKLALRNPDVHAKWKAVERPQCHPLFRRRAGAIESWERGHEVPAA